MQSARATITPDFFAVEDGRKHTRRGAFTDNMKLPVHRWFRYSAGFSAEWVSAVIEERPTEPLLILDPFAGSATTLIAAQRVGIESVGFEAQSFVARVASAKLAWTSSPTTFYFTALAVLKEAKAHGANGVTGTALLLAKCFTPEALADLNSLRRAYEDFSFPDNSSKALTWLALTAILRETSHVGTAQWQYVLPQKTKAKTSNPFDAFRLKIEQMFSDMEISQAEITPSAQVLAHDARVISTALSKGSVDLVITSPPYPNNYDYADATRLETSFWGEIESWGDLHKKVRKNLLTSCSQHSAAEKMDLEELLEDPLLRPIYDEISSVCYRLAAERAVKPGKKTYDTMVAAYFRDLAGVWRTLRYHMKTGGLAYFVVGDSAPYGVHVPAERWLGVLALANGFDSWTFEKVRDRNIKWKNRKHRVPLQEGIMRVQG